MNRLGDLGWPALLLVAVLAGGCAGSSAPRYDYEAPSEEENLAELNLKMGVEYMRRGREEVAMEKLQRSLALSPDNFAAHNTIALLYERQGEMGKARQHFQEALRLNPRDSSTHNNYGSFLCRQDDANQMREAEQHFIMAVRNRQYKKAELAYTNAGICALRYNSLEKAEAYFRKALEKNPNYPVALYQMGEVSYNQGKYIEARSYLKRYLELASHTPQTLWLGIRTERKLGDHEAAASYSLLLRSKFPESPETRLLHETESAPSS